MRAASCLSVALFISTFLHMLVNAQHRTNLHHIQRFHTRSISEDMAMMTPKRKTAIINKLYGVANIPAWLASQMEDGAWPDVNYSTGCAARRANWPGLDHWRRILTMSGAYRGGGNGNFRDDPMVLASLLRAMDYWNIRDFTVPQCLDYGGVAGICPCETPGFWNTNWYSNIIGLPLLSTQTCLLLGIDILSEDQLNHCALKAVRSYDTLTRPTGGLETGIMTGANLLDIALIGVDLSLLDRNETRLVDAYDRVHAEAVVRDTIKADGIRADGAFGQHSGNLYNGNYGYVFAEGVVQLETLAIGTQLAAGLGTPIRTAISTLFDANRWMIFRNTVSNRIHWDFPVIGRFISAPVVEGSVSSGVTMSIDLIRSLGTFWNSPSMVQFASALSQTSGPVNAGTVTGNRMFFTHDLMVHRTSSHVTSLKMLSARIENTECVNSQNILGFHLSDGAVYTHITGNEYTDIFASWDWNLIPGITTDYGNTPLYCGGARRTGLDKFVGGASDGTVGIAAQRYTNPFNGNLRFQKAWLFLDDGVQHVLVNNMTSTSMAPVYSVLDQRIRSGGVFVNGTDRTSALTSGNPVAFNKTTTLWHGGVGYALDGALASGTLQIRAGERTGSWQTIGTSNAPLNTKDVFAAWIKHNNLKAISYTVFPGTTSNAAFVTKKNSRQIQTVVNTSTICAIFDVARNKAFVVFWDKNGGSVTFQQGFTLKSTGKGAVIYNRATGNVTVSEPSQTSTSLKITIGTKTLTFILPQGGLAGSSITKKL